MAATITAWPGKLAAKQKHLRRMRAHIKADQLVAGTGFDPETHKGCAIGCTLDKYDHREWGEVVGVSEQIARIVDFLFERLPKKDRPKFILDVLGALRPGADTSRLWADFAVRMQTRNLSRVTGEGKVYDDVRAVIKGVIDLYAGDDWRDSQKARAAYAAARAADAAADAARAVRATDAAYAAADAARAACAVRATDAAYAAAYAAARAVRAACAACAAYAAARAARAVRAAYAAYAAARDKEIRQQADDLIELMRDCSPKHGRGCAAGMDGPAQLFGGPADAELSE